MQNTLTEIAKTKIAGFLKYVAGKPSTKNELEENLSKLEGELSINTKLVTDVRKREQEEERQLYNDNELLQKSLDTLNKRTDKVQQQIGYVEQSNKDEKKLLETRKDLLKQEEKTLKSLMNKNSDDLKLLEKDLELFKTDEKEQKVEVTKYLTELNNLKVELQKIKEILQKPELLQLKVSNLHDADELNATAKAYKRQADLLNQEKNYEQLVQDKKTLLEAASIKLQNLQANLGTKQSHIDTINIENTQLEAQLTKNQKEQEVIKDKLSKINLKIQNLTDITSRYDFESSSLSPQSICQRVAKFSEIYPTKQQKKLDSSIEEQEEEESKSPDEFQQDAPRSAKIINHFHSMKKLLESDFREKTDIEIQLYTLIDEARVEEFFNFFLLFMSPETGKIEGNNLALLKEDAKFIELQQLIMNPSYEIASLSIDTSHDNWRTVYAFKENESKDKSSTTNRYSNL